ncbi:MAG: beta-lactamase family protein [Acidobacteriales bacterium]|nr:beta-lactamase family protein [Terriglobales bacterium]
MALTTLQQQLRVRILCLFSITVSCAVLIFPLAARSQHPQLETKKAQVAAAPAPSAAHALTAQDVEAFLGGLIPAEIARNDIAGATVAIVKDGKLLFAKGYGYADLEKRVPVSAEGTLFRPGSVSKLFTWTAVMQLVEQGKLDLDRDVNEYLDFKIPATYSQPITLRHIMTHTPGFEEVVKDLFVRDASQLRPLRDYVANRIPRRIFPPGKIPAYSNYATALAGYIVERVSGQPYNDYVRDAILIPLGMNRSTFAQPLPPELEPLMSKGYKLGSKGSKQFEVVQAWPAGSLSATATDIARFMLAHLQQGRLEKAQILKPETARLMHARQFGYADNMNGMALGFYEEDKQGRHIIGHGGDTQYFHSDLHLMLDANLGFFISYNSQGRADVSPRSIIWQRFLERYFPHQAPAANPPSSAAADSRAVAGSYIASRRSGGSVITPIDVLSEAVVTAKPDGSLEIDPFKSANGKLRTWRPVGPFEYRDDDRQDRLLFKRDDSGKMVMVVYFPILIFEAVSGTRSKQINLLLVGASVGLLALTVLLWPVAAVVRRRHQTVLPLSRKQNRVRVVARLACLLNVIAFAAWVGTLLYMFNNIGTASSAFDGRLHLLQALVLVGVLATPLLFAYAYIAWKTPEIGLFQKLLESLVALAGIGFIWSVVNWHVLSFGLRY